jgi:hypothetical protein
MSARSVYLMMSAYGLDLETGRLGNLDPRTEPDSLARLRVALHDHEAELRRLIDGVGCDEYQEAVRQEARIK